MKIIKYTLPFVFILAGLLIYSNVLHGPFIFDDNMYITDNYWISDIVNILKDFSGTRYIGFLSFSINYYFGGLNTFGYHLVNILIHILNTTLVYFLIKITFNKVMSQKSDVKSQDFKLQTLNSELSTLRYLPFIVSLIFLVHPIQTQSVSYITQRFTSLATLFYLLAILLYIKARITGQGARDKGQETTKGMGQGTWGMGKGKKTNINIPLYILSILSAILAMKTKEISFTLPFIILFYEWTFPLNKGGQGVVSHLLRENNIPLNPPLLGENNNPLDPPLLRGNSAKMFFYLLPFFLTLLIIPINLLLTQDTGDIASAHNIVGDLTRQQQILDLNLSRYSYLLTQFRVIITYMRLLILPINQTFEYDFPLSNSIFEPATFIAFILLILLFSFAVYLYFRSRITHHVHGLLISFGILWFFITLSVESSIIPIKDVIFEHRLYLPSIGFILSSIVAISFGINQIEKYYGISLEKQLLSVTGVIIIILAVSTYKRNVLWNDSYLMYLDNIEKSPNRPDLRNALGLEYYMQNRIDEAIEEYQKAIKLDIVFESAYNNLGLAYAKLGRREEAIAEFQKAIRLKPNDALAYNNLGLVYDEVGRKEKAIEEYQKAIRIRPDYAPAHSNLGSAYLKLGHTEEAIEEFQKAVRFKPDYAPAYYNLGSAYEILGQIYYAIEEYKKALRLEPDNADAHNNLGSAYAKLGRTEEAIEEFQKAIRLKPNDSLAYYNLGLAYMEKGLNDEAIKELKEALKIRPDFIEARQSIDRLK